jgi:hypothetical protein
MIRTLGQPHRPASSGGSDTAAPLGSELEHGEDWSRSGELLLVRQEQFVTSIVRLPRQRAERFSTRRVG